MRPGAARRPAVISVEADPSLVGGNLGPLVYGTKGGVDLGTATYFPREPKGTPVKLIEGERGARTPGRQDTHISGFFDAIRTGAKTTADLRVGCTAALTCVLGRESIYQKKTLAWPSN
jgi:hypothetical protein